MPYFLPPPPVLNSPIKGGMDPCVPLSYISDSGVVRICQRGGGGGAKRQFLHIKYINYSSIIKYINYYQLLSIIINYYYQLLNTSIIHQLFCPTLPTIIQL